MATIRITIVNGQPFENRLDEVRGELEPVTRPMDTGWSGTEVFGFIVKRRERLERNSILTRDVRRNVIDVTGMPLLVSAVARLERDDKYHYVRWNTKNSTLPKTNNALWTCARTCPRFSPKRLPTIVPTRANPPQASCPGNSFWFCNRVRSKRPIVTRKREVFVSVATPWGPISCGRVFVAFQWDTEFEITDRRLRLITGTKRIVERADYRARDTFKLRTSLHPPCTLHAADVTAAVRVRRQRS